MVELKTIQIVSSPDLLGGKPCIEGRRITVQQVVEHHLYLGWTLEEMQAAFDLRPAEVYAALAYYYDHREEIDRAITASHAAWQTADQHTAPDLAVLDHFLSTRQAAKRLGISKRRVRQLCESGRLSPAKKLGTNWFIHPDALESGAVKNRKPGRPATR
jgi:excisionase family DNA binding protein